MNMKLGGAEEANLFSLLHVFLTSSFALGSSSQAHAECSVERVDRTPPVRKHWSRPEFPPMQIFR